MIRNAALAITAVLVSFTNVAFAQTSPMSPQQIIEHCTKRFSAQTPSAQLQRILCAQEENMKALERRMQTGEAGLTRQVEELKRQLEASRVELERARTQPNAPALAPSTSRTQGLSPRELIERRLAEIHSRPLVTTRPPVTTRQPDPSEPAPTRPQPAGSQVRPVAPPPSGPQYRLVPTPGQYAATTFDVDGPRLRIHDLAAGVETHVWGADQVRIVVKRNGVPIPIGHADGTFDPFYVDLNRDGKPDRFAFAGVDPFMIDEIFVSQVGPSDRIEVIYLVPTGRNIELPGYPPMPLWGDPVRIQLDRVQRLGRWAFNTTGGWKLR